MKHNAPPSAGPPPDEPSPPRISSERVRLLTSWKLWLPMLFVALLLIVAALLWPTYQRMRAMEFLESKGEDYLMLPGEWDGVARRLGRLGKGLRSIGRFELYEPISLTEFQLLTTIRETGIIYLETERVTEEWIEGFRSFFRLKDLAIHGEITTAGILQLLENVPTLQRLTVGRITDGDRLSFSDLQVGGRNLTYIRIEACGERLTIEGFPKLSDISCYEHEVSLDLRHLPALTRVRLNQVAEATRFTFDVPPEHLSIGAVTADRLVIAPQIRKVVIGSMVNCTVTGGEDLEELSVGEGANITFEGLSALQRLECMTSFEGTLTLRDLPSLQHFILMTSASSVTYTSPWVEFDGVDNLRAIDAPQWMTIDSQIAEICKLPRLEHLVIPKSVLTVDALPLLQGVETLRFLRLSNRILAEGEVTLDTAEQQFDWGSGGGASEFMRSVNFDELRRDFPQPGIRIHGPPRSNEQNDRWSSEEPLSQ